MWYLKGNLMHHSTQTNLTVGSIVWGPALIILLASPVVQKWTVDLKVDIKVCRQPLGR